MERPGGCDDHRSHSFRPSPEPLKRESGSGSDVFRSSFVALLN